MFRPCRRQTRLIRAATKTSFFREDIGRDASCNHLVSAVESHSVQEIDKENDFCRQPRARTTDVKKRRSVEPTALAAGLTGQRWPLPRPRLAPSAQFSPSKPESLPPFDARPVADTILLRTANESASEKARSPCLTARSRPRPLDKNPTSSRQANHGSWDCWIAQRR